MSAPGLFGAADLHIAARARSWLSSKIMATEDCIERLEGIRNDAVKLDAQASEIRRLREDVEVWRYLLGRIDG